MKRIILFDGVCNLCNSSVQFVVKHDPKMFFQFTSLQSEKGQQLLREYQIPSTVESVVLIEGSKYYTESTAALKIAKKLNNLYPLLFGLIIIPRPVRNKIYRYIARNRYRWFGKRTSCMLPGTEDRNRFLQ
ncbi:Predicted thiol-disulfide oxidoreductase YuxK, DCC family [Gracilibacillus ureilyticus]|uniref:Predicted thiol-disulfide oxidoreductase YuxK, DCC family n=1 Tax=Gracilibacillus ureilyticus TaxID=531814 RepID=A0A1H9SQI7_9BACI|nr:DCC1-like thiol-disulfide oxidoreductase family protein [Gracilibacillus ureilyticus]SER87270.1 Predicted thiol-disulfide oxidoreductase YuxK, DCC family [Gracilibacillus ureilyticus]